MKRIFKIGLWSMISAAMAAAVAYLFRRQLFQRWLKLSPAQNEVVVEEGLLVRMRDGIFLATDHYLPANVFNAPTILIRTPYGRGGRIGLITKFYGHRFAERGYHVIIQDVRGRFDSEGQPFEPFIYEAQDGADTIEWLKSKPWFNGDVGLWGASYLGYVQWALLSQDVPEIKAIVPITTQSNLGASSSQSMLLDNILRWMLILDAQMDEAYSPRERFKRISDAAYQDQLIKEAVTHLPVKEVDKVLLKQPMPFYQTWNEHQDRDDAYWQAINHNQVASESNVPAYMVAGWYDIFIKGQLEDYARMKAAGQNPYLIIGPWIHVATEMLFGTIRLGLHWFDQHLKGESSQLQPKPVRVAVMSAGSMDNPEWRDYDSWPPASIETSYFLHADERLVASTPAAAGAAANSYTYNPADPTPNMGGPLLASSAGPIDNRPLEAREDVLVFTTDPLTTTVEVVGHVKLQLYVRSSRPYTDFFGRLCDVQPDGRSMNVCDGLIRLKPEDWKAADEDGTMCVEVDLTATAYRFLPGHRIRLQVSSGAHPRYGRNLGTGEPDAHGEQMLAAVQMIFHDLERPSQLFLPITQR